MTANQIKKIIEKDVQKALNDYIDIKINKHMPTIALIDLITNLTIIKNSENMDYLPDTKKSLEIIIDDLTETLNRTK